MVHFIHRCSEAGVQPHTDVPYADEVVTDYMLSHVLRSTSLLSSCTEPVIISGCGVLLLTKSSTNDETLSGIN